MKKKSLKFGSVCLSIATLTSAMAAAPLDIADNNVVTEELYATGAVNPDEVQIDEESVIDSVGEYYEALEDDDSSAVSGKTMASGLPNKVDNSTSKYFPKIRNQGNIGSCTNWGQVYYQYTYTVNKARNVATTDLNTYSPEWTYSMLNGGVDEGTNDQKLYELMKSQGMATIVDAPITGTDYLSWHPTEAAWKSSIKNRIQDYQYFTSIGDSKTQITSAADSDLELIKTALSNGEILAYTGPDPATGANYTQLVRSSNTNGFTVDNSYIGQYAMTSNKEPAKNRGYHRMTIVGYNDNIWVDINGNSQVDSGEMGAFKIANSWGDWKNSGFCWVAYDSINKTSAVSGAANESTRVSSMGGIARIEVDSEETDSGLYLKYTINSADRRETSLTVTAKKDGGISSFSSRVNPYQVASNVSSAPEAYSYDGTQSANDGTMVLDLDQVVEGITPETLKDYDWSVEVGDSKNNDTALTVRDIRIVDSRSGKEYPMDSSSFTLNGQYKTVNIDFAEKEYTAYINITPTVNVGLYENVKIKAGVSKGKAPYQYKYTYTRYGQTFLISDYSSNNTITKQLPEMGPYAITVTVKDADGKTTSATKTVVANTTYIMKLNTSIASASVGETVKITPETLNLASVMTANTFKYSVTKDGKTQTLTTDSDKTAIWTPTEGGTYQIKLEIVYNSKTIVSKTIDYTVKAPENSITIYYKGYSTPYIHYQVGSGSWTSVPGAAMTPTSEVSGYTHKYTISLGSASSANVCFNDGNGSWDSRNGANYQFTKGTYTYSNGTIKTYNVTPDPDPNPTPLAAYVSLSPTTGVGVYENVKITAGASGGKAPYQYKYTYTKYATTTVIADYSANATVSKQFPEMGPYAITVTVKDADGNTATATQSVTVNTTYVMKLTADKSSAKAGETIKITPQTSNLASVMTANTFKYTVTKDNKTQTLTTNSDKTANWTPSEEGTYKVKLEIVYDSKTIASNTLNYTVEKAPENQITIYYKGYSTPYIHYQVGNGSWTSVPGVAMTQTSEVSGYTHKYTINLGTASYANVCFNDGKGSWDSKNGSNYYFTKGTYTYSNGTITKR